MRTELKEKIDKYSEQLMEVPENLDDQYREIKDDISLKEQHLFDL